MSDSKLKSRWLGKEKVIDDIIKHLKTNNDDWPSLLSNLKYADEIQGKRDLRGVPLSNLDLSHITFKNINMEFADLKNANLSNAIFENINIRNADLSSSVVYDTDFKKADLIGCNIDNIKMNEGTDFGPFFAWLMDKRKIELPKWNYLINRYIIRYLGYKGKIYSETIAKSKEDYREVKKLYRSLRLAYKNFDQGFSDYFYYREWHCEMSLHPFWHPAKWIGIFWEKISCSGTSPSRLFVVLITTIFLFALIYILFPYGIVRNINNEVIPLKNFGEALYFSIVTFTSLGYGDFHPNHNLQTFSWIKYLCAFEAIIGVTSLAMMIAIFLNFMKKD